MSVFLSDVSEIENPSRAAYSLRAVCDLQFDGCALTHPILREVDPQRVVKLIQEFNELLSL